MPYISNVTGRRDLLDKGSDPLDAGELTYVLTRAVNRFIGARPKFWLLCVALGALLCTILELYRRRVGPYEDQKCRENGDVYT